jgi:acyl-CoA synthetase (AMP-forming)/AMP-acid ligase II
MRPEELVAAPFGTIPELVHRHASERPDHPALVQGGERLDYATLDMLVDRVACALQRDGLAPRESIALCAANRIEYLLVFLGALRAGIVPALIAPGVTPQAIAAMVADAGARLFFLDRTAGEALTAARQAVAARRIALDGSDVALAFHDWLASSAAHPRRVEIEPQWAFNIIYSSGTTGAPKGIVQPCAMRWAHIQRGPPYGYSPDTISLISTPFYSNTTLVALLPTIALGGTVVSMARFDAGQYLELAQQHRVTHTMLVPVQYQRILAREDFAAHDLSSFRMKFSTSAPFAAALKEQVLERWPGGLVEYYGMTEGGGTAVLLAHEHRAKLHTVGRPGPGSEFRVLDEAGSELPPGEIGEFVGRSGAMMTGYHRQPELTAQAEWFDQHGRRFIRTGDVGRIDEDGFLVLLDRRKDLVISGGFNVYPADLEAVLSGHPDVAEVAVVAKPSVAWGETPFAFVVPAKGTAPDPEHLREWANARLGKTQRIAGIALLDVLPRNAIGKVLKRELRALVAREVVKT